MGAIRILLNGKSWTSHPEADGPMRTAVATLRRDGHGVEVWPSWEGGDLVRLTRAAMAEAAAGGVDTIIAAGGDGTVNAVFGTAVAHDFPEGCSFGILPLGTANDFARSAGLPVGDLTAALRIAASAPPVAMDIGLLGERPFVNLLTGGFGSQVTAETDPELKRRLGGLAYAITGIARLQDLSASAGRFRAEGFDWQGSFLALAIGNGRQAGGGFPLCPDALVDDGLLDLTILPTVAEGEHLGVLAGLLREGPDRLRSLARRARSSWIEFEGDRELNINLDGEPLCARHFRVECRPAALQVRLGPSPLFAAG